MAFFRDFDEGDRFFSLDRAPTLLIFKELMEELRFPKVMNLTPETADYVLVNQHNAMIFVAAAKPKASEGDGNSEERRRGMMIEEENKRAYREFTRYTTRNVKFKFFHVFEESKMSKQFLDSVGRSHVPDKPYVIMLKFENPPMSKYRFETRITNESLNAIPPSTL